MKGGIFISYRRDDAPAYAGRLYDRLASHFGKARVFMDVEGIEPGTDFVDAIERAVTACDVLIVVIGRSWLAAGPNGARRIDDTGDFVRIETATALKRDIRVVPVLVEDASMPAATELPPDLAPLARRQAIEVNHRQWDATSGELIATLERLLGGAAPVTEDAAHDGRDGDRRSHAAYWAGAAVLAAGVAASAWYAGPWHARDAVTKVEPTTTLAGSTVPATTTAQGAATLPATTTGQGAATLPATTTAQAAPSLPAATTSPPAVPPPRSTTDPSNEAAAKESHAKQLPVNDSPPRETPKATPPKEPTKATLPSEPRAEPPSKAGEQRATAPATADVPPIASAAPAHVAASSKLPHVGDRWQYVSTSIWKNVEPRTYVHRVTGVSDREVHETIALANAASASPAQAIVPGARFIEWRGGGFYLVEFNPFLQSFDDPKPGTEWKGLDTPTADPFYTNWYGRGRVVGWESVTVPAGTFNALRIDLDSSRKATASLAMQGAEPTRVVHVAWYAPEVKRTVKQVRTVYSPSGRKLDEDTLALASYSVQ